MAPHARAQRIGKLEEAIGGPHAIGRVGDFILENDQIRVVIADTGAGNDTCMPANPCTIDHCLNTDIACVPPTYGRVNTTYGGSLVDADLVRPGGDGKGNDQLAELLPGFVFAVIDPTSVEVTASGDGDYAEVTVTGTGGDLFEMVYLLNTGLFYPSGLVLTQRYRLYPGKRYVEMHTTIVNQATGAHPFPYFNPTQLDALLGMNVPGISALQLSVPLGQLPLFGGEQSLFAPGVAGFNVRFAIEDSYKTAGGFPAFPGMAIDFLATRGPGVSYGLAMPKSDDNYINAYRSGYAGQDITPYSMLIPFTYAGVAGVYMYKPPDQLNAGEQYEFTSYFVVGRGDVASVADAIYEQRGEATGTFGGQVVDERSSAPVVGASVIILDGKRHPIDQAVTDASGSFLAHLPPGTYSYLVVKDDRLTTQPAGFEVVASQQVGVLVQMAPPATIAVDATDAAGRHVPVKIQLLGHFDPTKVGQALDPKQGGRSFLYSAQIGERERTSAFDGTNRFVEGAWWTTDGKLEVQVRPGTYDLVITRGPEYEITTQTVTLDPGAFVGAQPVIRLAYASDGWVAGDFHIHAQPSTDSGLPIADRVASCAAEGLEVATSTDHNFITDYAPVIAASGLDTWLLGIPGMELTTFEMGHFNGYPLKVDPGSTRGGEFLWAHQLPAKLFDQLRNDLAADPGNGIVQVNHPRQTVLGYWAQFFIDAATGEPYTPSGILGVFAPYGDEFRPENYSFAFDAVELLTGKRLEDVHTFVTPSPLPPGPFPDPQPVPGTVLVGKDGRPQFPGVVETWFTMLDRGHRATGMGTSDAHHLLGDEPGYARTMVFVGAGKDVPGGYTRDDVVGGIKGHHAIVTNAPFLEMAIGDHIIGDTIVAAGGSVDVVLRVRSATWAPVDHLRLYSNGGALVYDKPIPAGQGSDYTTTVHLQLAKDAWVVAEATGTGNMFPVLSPTELPPLDATVIITALTQGLNGLNLSSLPIAGALKPQRLHFSTPYAITNPIWIDVDGGGWTPPQAPLPMKSVAPRPVPDVRDAFDTLPEVTP